MNLAVQPSDDRMAAAIRLLPWIAVYFLAGAIALLPIVDPDIWWHLRIGQWLLTHREFPVTDPFSRGGDTVTWYAYSWLYEVLVYGTWSLLGFRGIFLMRCLLTLAIVAALHRFVGKRQPNFAIAGASLSAAVVGMLPLFTERPWLFTLLFSILTLDVVLDVRAGKEPWIFWFLPVLFALWANLHIQFIYGLFMLGLACLAPLLDRFFGIERELPSSWRRLVLITVLCTAATLLTPYHVRLYLVVREYAGQKVPLAMVEEMKAMGFRDAWDWAVLALAAAAVFALGRRRTISTFEILLLAGAAWFGFRAKRDVWFLILASLAVIAPTPSDVRPFLPVRWQRLAVAGVVAPLLGLMWFFATTGPGFGKTLGASYPVKAVGYVKEHQLPGPLFNDYNWGGYLMWELPEMPVSMDGRANLYGDARMQRAFDTWQGKPGWDEDPDLKSARLVIADVKMPLTSLLRLDKRFRVVHEGKDEPAVVFVAVEAP